MASRVQVFVIGASLCIALAGCTGATDTVARNAAAEEEIDLQPGQYRISYDASLGGLAPQGGTSSPDTVCVTESTAASWPEALIIDSYGTRNGCSFTSTNREGNAVNGEYVCEMSRGSSWTKMKMSYSGDVSATRSQLKTRQTTEMSEDMLQAEGPEQAEKMKATQAALNAVEVTVTAERVGDCP
jgi:hypothetical protein